MALDSKCAVPAAVKIKVLKDRKGGPSELRIHNENDPLDTLRVYVVDDCLIKAGERCDFLVFPNRESVLFVELKGGDVPRGLVQLQSTIASLAAEIGTLSRYATLVATRCPLSQSDIAIAQTRMKKQHRCVLKVKNMRYECKTTDFA